MGIKSCPCAAVECREWHWCRWHGKSTKAVKSTRN